MPQIYGEVENVRITYVPAGERRREANWAGTDVIRIQAYRPLEYLFVVVYSVLLVRNVH